MRTTTVEVGRSRSIGRPLRITRVPRKPRLWAGSFTFLKDEKYFSLSREVIWDFNEKLIHSWLSLIYRSSKKIL
jgi:hypothetical protein